VSHWNGLLWLKRTKSHWKTHRFSGITSQKRLSPKLSLWSKNSDAHQRKFFSTRETQILQLFSLSSKGKLNYSSTLTTAQVVKYRLHLWRLSLKARVLEKSVSSQDRLETSAFAVSISRLCSWSSAKTSCLSSKISLMTMRISAGSKIP